MFKKLFNGVFTLFGALIGYEAFQLTQFIIKEVEGANSPYAQLNGAEAMCMTILFVLIFSFIFYCIAPVLSRQGNKMAEGIGNDLKGVSSSDLFAGVIGLIIGLVIAFLLTKIYQDIVRILI